MKKGIVFKWFVLTALLFSTMFFSIGLTLNYFFEEYYMNEKSDILRTHMAEYAEMVVTNGTEALSRQFYRDKRIWVTKLDKYGRIKDVENYYIEVQLHNDAQDHLQIPMYAFEGEFSSNVLALFNVGDEVLIDAVTIADEKIPYLIQTPMAGAFNLALANKLHGPSAEGAFEQLSTGFYRGTISNTVLPEQAEYIAFPYQENLFLDQIKEFQAGLLAANSEPLQQTEERTVVENFVEYKIIIQPVHEDGAMGYIFVMNSLQPVDEAISVMRKFYPYVVGLTLLCILVLAFVFSRWLAKPLILINQITGKIANMDFTEQLPVRSDDEIGQLSQNINFLSNQMEEYIERLQHDLDRERKLENVRKEFIAGVSHELKTPLAVMKSCLSILKDGIATKKRDHYFQALEAELQRMDLLVVNMLDLAKFESGTYKPEMAPFQIDQVISEVCSSLKEQIDAKNLSLTTRVLPQVVVGHEGLISRVISNFISNAIRHTPNGHAIEVIVKRSGQMAKISVENQGPPIAAEDLSKIWDQFYRVGAQAKAGTGLGLSISQEILELHHADYGVENTQDGVRFYFSLPLHSNLTT